MKEALNALTGLRFVAAFVVFIHHVGGKFGIEHSGYSIGSLAVTFFFVLSGFILTYVYCDRMDDGAQVRRYLFTRFARIWPLHLVCAIVAIMMMHSWRGFSTSESWWKLATNLSLVHSWVPQTDWVFSYNPVSWSISTEAFFYLVFPFLCFGRGKFARRRLWFLLPVVVAAAIGCYVLSRQPEYSTIDWYRVGHVNPLLRLPEFLAGMLVGYLYLRRASLEPEPRKLTGKKVWLDSILEFVCFASIIGAGYAYLHFRVGFQVLNADWGGVFLSSWLRVAYPTVLFAFTVYVFARSQGVVSQLLSLRLPVYLGEVSYAFYMIHFLVIRFVYLAVPSYGALTGLQLAFLCFAISLACSILLYEWIEIPAKQAALKWFDRGIRASVHQFFKLAFPNFLQLKSWSAIFVVLASAVILRTHVPDPIYPAGVKKVLSASDVQLRNIDFGSEVRLLGADAKVVGSRRIELQLIWQQRIDITRRRMLQLYDAAGKPMARLGKENEVFEGVGNGEIFVDKILIPVRRLREADQVVVSFREKGRPALMVSRGPRIRGNRGLIVLDQARIKELFKTVRNLRDQSPQRKRPQVN